MIKFLLLKIIGLFSLIPSKFKIKILNNLLRQFNEKDPNYYFTINYRKKFFDTQVKNKNFKTSLIIQGPILRKDNFTLNTINLYLRNCNSDIILSTWENDLTKKEIENLKDKGVNIILNKLPNFNGPSNVNLQLKSTSEALKLSLKKGNQFSIKTRSDCRIYSKKFDKHLLNLYKFFIKKRNSFRIGSTSFTREKRLFGISEIIMFGKTKELLNYFPGCSSSEEFKKFNLFLKSIKNKNTKFLNDSYKCIPENFLCYNYLIKNVNSKIRYNFVSYFNCLKKYFMIIDNSTLDIFWYKYNHQYEHRDKDFSDKNLYSFLSFSKWLKNYY